jgi:hypothetical protein
MANFMDRLKHGWNAFTDNGADEIQAYGAAGASYGLRPDRRRINTGNDKSIITSIYTRMGIDVADVPIRHVRLDEEDRYLETIPSNLNNCLTLEANIDQAARAFRQDIAMTLFEKGVAAIVPVDTTLNPDMTGSYDIKSMRVGEVVTWLPGHVRVSLYNEKTGMREEITLAKQTVAIVDNPFYSVMNETSSTLQRLLRKLSLLDSVDEQAASGKLDLIIQLPYVIKDEARRDQAEKRRKDIEMQLQGSKYGIAYTDGTEKITQLNRAAENNMLKQVEYLTDMLYGQLGLTPEILNGTADEKTMLNYQVRTIKPILTAITEAMKRTFLTKTARAQRQSIEFFRNVFELAPLSGIGELADKLARNEIMTPNEFRGVLGLKPSRDPKADQLINSNMPQPSEPAQPALEAPKIVKELPPGTSSSEELIAKGKAALARRFE